jgi:predicted Abi (CAAX) family protease
VKASSSEWVAKYEASAADLQKVQSKNTILVEQATKVQANLVGNIDKLQYSSKAQEQRYKKMEQELIQKTMEADKIR